MFNSLFTTLRKFRPDQTRDDAGRFASEGQTTSVPTAAAHSVSPEQREFFKDSQVKDAAGNPLVVYHGSRADFGEFKTDPVDRSSLFARLVGAHFAEDPAVPNAFTAGSYAFASDQNISDNPDDNWYRVNGEIKRDGIPVVTKENVHGRDVPVDVFDPAKHGSSWSFQRHNPGQNLRMLIPGGTVYPVYLNIKNPLVVKNPGDGSMDDHEVTRAVARVVLPHRRDLFVKGMESSGFMPAESGKIWDAVASGKSESGAMESYQSWEDLIQNRGVGLFDNCAADVKAELVKCGYDGITYENTSKNELQGGSPTTWIAFHPNQIKSVFNRHPSGDPDISKAWEESEHPRDSKGKFTVGGSEPVYHITYANRLDQIAESGLQPNMPRSIGGMAYDAHSRGGVFVTDGRGVNFWHQKAEEMAENNSDDILGDKMVPVVLRVYGEHEAASDDIGSTDSRSNSAKLSSAVPPENIEFYDGKAWQPINEWELFDPSVAVDDGYFKQIAPLLPKVDVSKTGRQQETDFTATPPEEIRKRDASKLSASCVMALVEPADAVDFLEFGSEIPDAELYREGDDFGLEKSPHVTILYGIQSQDVGPVKEIAAKFGPLTVACGRVTMFDNADNDKPYQPLYVPVYGGPLTKFNRRLKALPYQNDYDGRFIGHICVAYLKRGEAKKWCGDGRFAGKFITMNHLVFSTPDHGKTVIPLGEVEKAFDPNQVRDYHGRWSSGEGEGKAYHASWFPGESGGKFFKWYAENRGYSKRFGDEVQSLDLSGKRFADFTRLGAGFVSLHSFMGVLKAHGIKANREFLYAALDHPSEKNSVWQWLDKAVIRQYVEKLKDQGFDGVKIRESHESVRGTQTTYGVFSSSIAKAFDPEQARDEHGRWTMGTGTPEFKTWFEGSTVVNPNGTPRVVYHGTKADFTSYDPATDMFGGFFVSDDPAAASAYSQGKWSGKAGEPVEGSNVMPCYINLKKPFDLSQPVTKEVVLQFAKLLKDDRRRMFKDNPEKLANWKKYEQTMLKADTTNAMRRENIWGALTQLGVRGVTRTRLLEKIGYDGTVFHGKDGVMGYTSEYTQYSVFRPDQIKSIWNRGSWDPKDPHISKTFDPDEPRNEHGEWTKDANHVDKPAGISDTGGMETKSELKYPGAKTRSQDPDDYHFISTGAKENFYTLRHRFTEATYANSEQGTVSTGAQERDYHLQNLSTDRDTANKQAEALTGLKLSAEFDVLPIGEKRPVDWSVFQSGKYVGSSIHEVREKDPDYLLWIAENQSPKSKTYGGTVELIQALMAHELKGRSDQRESEKSKAESEHDTRVEAFKPVALKLIGAAEWPDPTWQQDLRDPIPGRKDWEIKSGQANVKLLYHENTKTWEARDGGFVWSIAAGLMNGKAPTGRGATITADIVAKMEGKRNSKGYEAKYGEVMGILEKGAIHVDKPAEIVHTGGMETKGLSKEDFDSVVDLLVAQEYGRREWWAQGRELKERGISVDDAIENEWGNLEGKLKAVGIPDYAAAAAFKDAVDERELELRRKKGKVKPL